MSGNGDGGNGTEGVFSSRGRIRRPCTFLLDEVLVSQARREVGECDVVRSIEAALIAAIDYQAWVREVAVGKDDMLK